MPPPLPTGPAILALALASCAPEPVISAPPAPTGDPAAVTSAAAPPPKVDPERLEAVMRCRQRACSPLGKACFENCARHGHPGDPEAHVRCNDSCRNSYGIDACEAACERDPYPKGR